MMPLRIRRKGRGIEKLETPAAPQCRGRSFPREEVNRITLASTRGLAVIVNCEAARLPSVFAASSRCAGPQHCSEGRPCRIWGTSAAKLRIIAVKSDVQAHGSVNFSASRRSFLRCSGTRF